jgi:exodeoxyribonuclease VII large subunit
MNRSGMTGSVELDGSGTHLLIRFPYREDLVAEIREVPGRRWDQKHKTWRVPAAQVERIYATFSRHLFEFAPEVSSLLAGTLGGGPAANGAAPKAKAPLLPLPAPAPQEAPEPLATAADAISISALNQRVRGVLRTGFPETFWVVGEIVDFDKQAGRQHRFFSLVEKAPGEARPRARVEAALFERTAQMLLPRLAAADASFALQDGIEIRALVRVDLYPQTGRFQVVIEDIDATFTLGKMALSREEILRELRRLCLLDRNRVLPVPVPPRRVAVLASPDSDGWNDFLRHLEESRIGFDLTLVPVRVQGIELRPSVLRGLDWLAEHAHEFDVACILRGGGSRTDLAGFDDRGVALAVARHPLKILVGIGHQRDATVLDAIAHSEKTPTAVAAFLVRCVHGARAAVAGLAGALAGAAERRLAGGRTRLHRSGHDMQRSVAALLQRQLSFLAVAGRDLGRLSGHSLAAAGSRLAEAAARAGRGAGLRLERATARLDQQAARQRLLDPRAVLGRGYALVRAEDGRVLPAAARIRAGQLLTLQLRDGSVRSRAETVQVDRAP